MTPRWKREQTKNKHKTIVQEDAPDDDVKTPVEDEAESEQEADEDVGADAEMQ